MPGLVNLNWKTALVFVGGGFLLLYVLEKQIAAGAKAVGTAATNFAETKLNPASDQNFIYSGISSIGAAVTGNQNWTLGGALYNWTHPVASTGTPPQ